MGYQVVWFKRDLRWQDHAALACAAQRGPLLCLYIVEPELWAQPDAALQHFEFVRESLLELDQALRERGGMLHVRSGDTVQVLDALYRQAPFEALLSHQETGNGFTYARDVRVGAWCAQQGVAWQEFAQFGVVRRLRQRSTWQRHWEAHMAQPQAQLPAQPGALRFYRGLRSDTPQDMHAPAGLLHNPPQRQRGGREQAERTLHSFLHARALGYRGGISSPLYAPDACSRLSAYLAWGCISLREVVQSTRATLDALPPQARSHRAGLSAFVSRLYWHCHFIQKLETEPEIEWRNMHRGYDGLREDAWNPAHFAALTEARTGWPMVDACVVMLRETGWLNFRMRAMLVSVAAYALWLDWRPLGQWLATQFLDYEPGIHWSQLQMQSGTTGINTTRVYNPIKQAQDHDPHGLFVRRWLPAMRRVPDAWLFEPWRMPPTVQAHCGVHVGQDIAQPLLDWTQATRQAKSTVHARRAEPAVRAGKQAVLDQHTAGNTERPAKRTNQRTRPSTRKQAAPPTTSQQTLFDF